MKFLCITLALLCALQVIQIANGAKCTTGYSETDIVSSKANIPAIHHSTNLINPRGITFNNTADGDEMYVADSGKGVITIYNGSGSEFPLVITVPAAIEGAVGSPTGIWFSKAEADWVLGGSPRFRQPARLVGCTLDGQVIAWAPNWPPDVEQPSTQAVSVIDNSADGASYTGLDELETEYGPRIYLADFANSKVDIYDGRFKKPSQQVDPNAFIDPNMPAQFSPFNIKAYKGNLLVTFAKKAADGTVKKGANLGYISLFDFTGKFLKRVVGGGKLNAPWGMAIATNAFRGELVGQLLVGNYGDGRINAYDLEVNHPTATPLKIIKDNGSGLKFFQQPQLWSIEFGNGAPDLPKNSFFFSAGVRKEKQGLVGRVGYFKCPNTNAAAQCDA